MVSWNVSGIGYLASFLRPESTGEKTLELKVIGDDIMSLMEYSVLPKVRRQC